MKTLLFILLSAPLFCQAQKIFSDKTDPFTNVRTIITKPFNLKAVATAAILQCTASIEIKSDSIQNIKLSFIVPDLHTTVQSNDTSELNCLIKASSGIIYKGQFVSMANFLEHIGYTYSFSSDDAIKIINETITDLKFNAPNGKAGLFQIDKDAENRIGKACAILIDKSKT
jgi:prefoldin subunit 5